MKARHAAVVAGLALGLMSGAAKADTLEYNIVIDTSIGSVTGTIDTDYKAGVLSASDILGYDLFVGSDELSSNDGSSILGIYKTSLFAVGNTLKFSFDGKSGSDFEVVGNQAELALSASTDNMPTIEADGSSVGTTDPVQPGTILTIGISEGSVMSPVPLPASAPMFGAALMALGAVGCGLKRKKAAAAA